MLRPLRASISDETTSMVMVYQSCLHSRSAPQNNYVTVVALTAVGYDYVLTFSDEITYIWSKPWTWVSTLFVLVRYFGLLNLTFISLVGSSFLPGPAETYVFILLSFSGTSR
ncbi:hypothetical protein OG21DRAFT_748850 [Imleria badia]|nr:hypothetical protein OG21DRAFT_748850 [Imleria badia]